MDFRLAFLRLFGFHGVQYTEFVATEQLMLTDAYKYGAERVAHQPP